MNTPQPTRRLRAGLAIKGAQAARQHITRTAVLARQLDQIAPGVVEVLITPVTVDDAPRTHVRLLDALGLPLADREAHGAALRLLRHVFTPADWTVPQRYDVRTGDMTPAALGMDTAAGARR
ncbi:hypothetical protein ACFVWY_33920 [Streptomyces sp. NPDC058195]|uniref:hypothetical protein n=1 Tax=Streptomyces sp. NPDC058195 TaxID=3346375 RepID=UPI0036E8C8A0